MEKMSKYILFIALVTTHQQNMMHEKNKFLNAENFPFIKGKKITWYFER